MVRSERETDHSGAEDRQRRTTLIFAERKRTNQKKKEDIRFYEKLCVYLLIIAFALSMIPGVTAVQTGVQEISKDTWRLEFQEGLKLQSTLSRRNIEAVAEKISEVAFTVDGGKDVFTMGYYFGDTAVSYITLIEKAEELVKSLNEDIAQMEILAGNTQVELEDVQLRYVAVTDVRMPESESSAKLVAVANQLIGLKEEVTEYWNMVEQPSAGQSLSAIDSSYHYQLSDHSSVLWHNGMTESACNTTAASPHRGDGNQRYASGYQWHPDIAEVSFVSNVSAGKNRTMLQYRYGQNALNNLVYDENEALEIEVQFYNYNSYGTSAANLGSAFQCSMNATWISSQPGAYLDTNFSDDQDIVALCVGCPDASQLVANTYYYWRIDSDAGDILNYPNDGRFRITAQRSYRNGGSSTWHIFGEEHEPQLVLGISNLYNWVPATQNAWVLAESGQSWRFNNTMDPVREGGSR